MNKINEIKNKFKKMEFTDYLNLFNVNKSVESYEEFYDVLDTHTTTGEYTSDRGVAISSEYWDYSEYEIDDILAERIENEMDINFVKIGNRYFEAPVSSYMIMP